MVGVLYIFVLSELQWNTFVIAKPCLGYSGHGVMVNIVGVKVNVNGG